MRAWKYILRQFDMLDATDKPQFSKLVIVYLAGIATFQGWLGTTLAIALIAAAFGRSVFTAFLNRSQFTSNDSTEVKRITQEITTRRANGEFEESP